MSRAARITVGAVLAGVLAFVAVVAGAMAGASSFAAGGFLEDPWLFEGAPAYVDAEVLDVDDDLGWTTLDVRYTTEDGEVVVTWVDWEHDGQVPGVGDRVEVVYDSADPEWSFAADDPTAAGVTDGASGPGGGSEEPEGTTGFQQVSGWVSLGALVLLVLTVVVTVVAAVRAPAPARPAGLPVDPFAWQPGHLPPSQGYIAPVPGHQHPRLQPAGQQVPPPGVQQPAGQGAGARHDGRQQWQGPA